MIYALRGVRPPLPFARLGAGALVALAACVGVSRIVLGFHFPLDVGAGAVLGGTMGSLGGHLFVRLRARTRTVGSLG